MKKLKFELIPDGCFQYNLRNMLSKKAWDFIREDAKERSKGCCSICKKKSSRLEAHEQWSYDTKNGIIKLEDVISVCPLCHSAIHINRTYLKGDFVSAEKQYMKVNNCSYVDMRKDLGDANKLQEERNKVDEWKMDISWIKRFIKD